MDVAGPLGRALQRRLAEVVAASERLRAFVFEPGEQASAPPDEPGTDALRDLVLRALHVVSDPVNYALVRRLADGDAPLDALAATSGLPAVAASERVNDLLQVGLVSRDLHGDRVGLTEAGEAVVALVEAAAGGEA